QLDPLSAVHIYDTLKTVNEQFGTTVIVIEHHTEFIADYCKHAVLMEQGSVAWKLETASALNEVETLLAHQIHPPQVTQAAWRIYPERKPYPIRL
ncbi:ABC transporter ATP-binding protein, partial [Paenibacillus sepulcri]|nr:ABC transporter ATP-binding protein [Paenibacillus sepulcri]